MSRIGRKLIPIAKGVKVQVADGRIKVTGPKGELSAAIPKSIGIEIKENDISVTRSSDIKAQVALHGTWRALQTFFSRSFWAWLCSARETLRFLETDLSSLCRRRERKRMATATGTLGLFTRLTLIV